MAKVFPFRSLRPRPELAAEVASVPYDVVSRDEARALAEGNPVSFLRVTKPEIDLPDSVDVHDDRVYKAGAAALDRFVRDGTLFLEETPRLHAYQLTMGSHTQTGVVLCASVADYDRNIVKKHELTRPDKENDRVKHMEALGAQSGTVFLAHKDSDAIADVLSRVTQQDPWADFTAPDGVVHRAWEIASAADIQALQTGFADLGPIYIADGHHRSAAASRVAASRRQGSGASTDAEHERFLAVSFPESEMQILPYNRVVKDLGEMSDEAFLRAVGERFELRESDEEPVPKQFGMYLNGRWYTLTAREGSYDLADPVGRLDVSILQEHLLSPVLGIEDPRRDARIDFVGGIRGDSELVRRVSNGWAVAFKLHATAIADLFAIADAEQVMPPKSTWFEPKLRDGLFVHQI